MADMGDLKRFGISFLVAVFILKSLFFEEEPLLVVRVAAGLYWLLIVPGIGWTYLWGDLAFEERFLLGAAISASLVGILSYYLGLLGIGVGQSALFLPPLLLLASLAAVKKVG